MGEVKDIAAAELSRRIERGDRLVVLDVREPGEIAIARFPNSLNIPMNDVPARLSELDPSSEIVVVCHHGVRSAHVAAYLAHNGFARVLNLRGGIDAWSIAVDSSVPRY
jgi:rhodanese-related sulfurtransferase